MTPPRSMPPAARGSTASRAGRPLAALLVLVLAACNSLSPTATPPPAFYAFDGGPAAPVPPKASASAPVVAITPTRAAPGFDSQRIIYLRDAYQLAYFSHSEWVEPPARMLGPLLVAALERSATFRAVVLAGASGASDYRLDTELVRLQHDFRAQPSSVLLQLRATLVDDKTRRVVAVRQFNAIVPSPSEDPRGGVTAANRAVQQVLAELTAFCTEAIINLPPSK